jgi:hypothetical protein
VCPVEGLVLKPLSGREHRTHFFILPSAEALFPFGAAKSSHSFSLATVLRSLGVRVFVGDLYFVKWVGCWKCYMDSRNWAKGRNK